MPGETLGRKVSNPQLAYFVLLHLVPCFFLSASCSVTRADLNSINLSDASCYYFCIPNEVKKNSSRKIYMLSVPKAFKCPELCDGSRLLRGT